MGKWTSEYRDDVLGAKIKSLVSGAVTRSKLEKIEPSISYETFVDELDPGDSFTTTLMELLVREMAERRQRKAADRRLISDRTAKGLRTLASPQRVYRDRNGRGVSSHRPLNLTDYLSVPPDEMELDDDNDSLESMIDHSGTIEGARMNTDLYDAYANPGPSSTEPHISSAPPHMRHMLRSANRREDWVLLRDTSPDGWGPPSPTAAPSAPPLTRQPSIRRLPARPRTVDFTDFTSRRRSSGRESNSMVTSVEPEGEETAAPTTTSSRLSPNTTNVPPRRFFPSRRPELPWSPVPESASATSTGTSSGLGTGPVATPNTRLSPTPGMAMTQADGRPQRTFLSSLPSSALLSLPPPPQTDLRSPRTTPRLRRGGVRPPESLLGRTYIAMLRTTSPEPMAGSDLVPPSVGDGASVGVDMEGDAPSLGNAPSLAPDTTLIPGDIPREQLPAPAE